MRSRTTCGGTARCIAAWSTRWPALDGCVLDAGCGTGGLLARLLAERPDLRPVGLEWAEPASRRAAAKSGAPIVRGSVNALPFADASFDAAIAADLLCHGAVDPAPALAELRRVLRPGGRLVVNMPAYAWLLSAHDRPRAQRAPLHRAPARGACCASAGFVRVRAALLERPAAAAHGGAAQAAGAQRRRASDVAPFPPWLDAMFHAITEIERRLPFRLPAGGSVLATAERP